MSEPPDEHIPGIHHVTSLAGDPARNVDFYTEVLGLRQVKTTVNHDDPSMYHLYYGDELGRPGTALTFFAIGAANAGRPGRGQVTATAFVAPDGSLDYWRDRLDEAGAETESTRRRFGADVLPFRDHDGHPMELIPGSADSEPWSDGPVPAERALRGFHGVTLDSTEPAATAEVLELLGFERAETDGPRVRFQGAGERARFVDLLDRPDAPRGRPGQGTVHHVAFRTTDEQTQRAWRELLVNRGHRVTEQKDRFYFKSIYFREPGGVLVEIATDGPGFTRDEPADELGDKFVVPPWLQSRREKIEEQLGDL